MGACPSPSVFVLSIDFGQIPTMEIIWSVLTMLLSTTNNFSSICALRFFVGEGTYPSAKSED